MCSDGCERHSVMYCRCCFFQWCTRISISYCLFADLSRIRKRQWKTKKCSRLCQLSLKWIVNDRHFGIFHSLVVSCQKQMNEILLLNSLCAFCFTIHRIQHKDFELSILCSFLCTRHFTTELNHYKFPTIVYSIRQRHDNKYKYILIFQKKNCMYIKCKFDQTKHFSENILFGEIGSDQVWVKMKMQKKTQIRHKIVDFYYLFLNSFYLSLNMFSALFFICHIKVVAYIFFFVSMNSISIKL